MIDANVHGKILANRFLLRLHSSLATSYDAVGSTLSDCVRRECVSVIDHAY